MPRSRSRRNRSRSRSREDYSSRSRRKREKAESKKRENSSSSDEFKLERKKNIKSREYEKERYKKSDKKRKERRSRERDRRVKNISERNERDREEQKITDYDIKRDKFRERKVSREREKDRDRKKDVAKSSKPPKNEYDDSSKDNISNENKTIKGEKTSDKKNAALIEFEDRNHHISEEIKKKKEYEDEKKIILEAMENERRKRRERIENWRKKMKKEIGSLEPLAEPTKSWNLDDENDEEEESIIPREKAVEQKEKIKLSENVSNIEEDNIDPLDAYMVELRESIKKDSNNLKEIFKEEEEQPAIIHTVVSSKNSGGRDVEILEQFGDAAEYSSEEEEIEETTTAVSKRNIKVIPSVDHNRVYYRNFRKNFYIEVPEIMKLSDQEVVELRKELGNLTVKGKGCPKPIKKWVQIGANPVVLEVLKKNNYNFPTAIQAQTLPVIMSGRDVISIARTGSGKTLAFLLPMFRHVLDQPAMVEGDGPIAIVLTPTRELAVQIYKECRKFTKHLGIKTICLYGGSVVAEQISELKRGAEIAICTPGRLIDMLSVNGGRITNCRRCTFLVLDEADRMFDLGFEPQVQKILEQIRPDRQICLFTATFSLSMEALARRVLHKPIEIVVGKRNKVCSDVKQYLLLLECENKFLKLLELLGIYSDAGRVLVFVERQETADDLLKDLITKGYPCMSIHGGRDQYDRDSSLSDFKTGVTNILVATSVASRGIDIKNIALVINYDCPNHGEDYVHRCGRTGRAGNKGTAITFITSRDAKYLKDILTVVENTNCEISQSIINLYQNHALSDKNRRIKSSGFSGRGFKFDDREMLYSSEQKKMIKWTFGWQDSGDEAEEEAKVLKKIEQSIEKCFGNRPQMGSGSKEDSVDKDKAELAKSIACKLSQKLKPTEQSEALDRLVTTKPKPKPESLPMSKNMKLAKEIADKLNIKIDPEQAKSSKKTESRKLTAGEVYFEEIDINDFPQLARQKISTKETLDAVAEMSDCCLTIRGSYCPGGKPLDFTDRRLHLLIEGTTEFKVQIAKAEVKRIIKEESVKSDYAFIQPSSRYRIV